MKTICATMEEDAVQAQRAIIFLWKEENRGSKITSSVGGLQNPFAYGIGGSNISSADINFDDEYLSGGLAAINEENVLPVKVALIGNGKRTIPEISRKCGIDLSGDHGVQHAHLQMSKILLHRYLPYLLEPPRK